MSFKLPGLPRPVVLSAPKLAALVILVPLLWVGYLGIDLWRTQRSIHAELPSQVFTPEPAGTPPSYVYPTSRPGARSTNTPTPTDGPETTLVGSGPTPYDPSISLPNAVRSATPVAIQPSSITDWHGKKRITVLLIGLDQRTGAKVEDARSDTIILASLDFEKNTASVLSVPRDLYVRVPGGREEFPDGFGYHKLNEAYSIGNLPKWRKRGYTGEQLLINTLRQNFNLVEPIDAYATVKFDGVVKGVDALGGIELVVKKKFVDRRYPKEDDTKYITVVFKKGLQRMSGRRALQYARSRHADNDFGRIKRQQQVILAVQQKTQAPSVILKIPALLDVVKGNFRTTLSLSEQLRLARWGAALPRQSIRFYSVPGTVTSRRDNGESIVVARHDDATEVLRAVFGPSARLVP